MRFLTALVLPLFATGASAQSDPLAPLPERPPQTQRVTSLQTATIPAASSLTGFSGYKQRLSGLALSAGVRAATVRSVVPACRSINALFASTARSLGRSTTQMPLRHSHPIAGGMSPLT